MWPWLLAIPGVAEAPGTSHFLGLGLTDILTTFVTIFS